MFDAAQLHLGAGEAEAGQDVGGGVGELIVRQLQGLAAEVVAQFAEEDLADWPFWKRGDGYHLRGRAYYITKDGAKAEADLTKALPWISDPRTRDSLLLTLAWNRERNLGDDDRERPSRAPSACGYMREATSG